MRKAMKGVLIGLVVTVLAVLIALPVAVPPIAETIVRDKLREFGLVNPYVRMKLGYGFNQIAKDSGVSLDAVQKRSARSSPRSSPPEAASGSSPKTAPGRRNNRTVAVSSTA